MKGVMSSDSAYWLECQVREDLRKQLVSLGQDCSVSIEAQVKDSSAEISHHLERHLEAEDNLRACTELEFERLQHQAVVFFRDQPIFSGFLLLTWTNQVL